MIYIYNKTVNSEFKVMKKFFIAICFSLFFVQTSFAAITPLNSYRGSLQPSRKNVSPAVKTIGFNDFANFLIYSIEHAKKATKQDLSGRTTAVVPSPDRQKKEQEKNKSIFEKIYDQAMNRANERTTTNRQDVLNPQANFQSVTNQQQQWRAPSVPTITVKMLPDDTPTLVPALEHIPYCMSVIEVLNNGLVKITETIMVVSNGQKLKNGLTKLLPAKVYNGKGKKQTLDYSIIGVLRNDHPEEYRMTSYKDKVLLVPVDDKPLAPGVYTYKFEYLVDNALIDKDDAYMLYWDVGGHGWNLVIDRLGAILKLPEKDGLLQHNVLFGNENNLYAGNLIVNRYGVNGFSYVAQRPLFVGEGMYLLAMIDKSTILPISTWQKFMHMFYDYNDILLAAVGCLFIVFSLFISWRYIRAQKKIKKFPLAKTASVMRYLFKDKFDIVSACGFLLEIYKKNLIDIQQSDDTILLIKRTDNIKSLAKFEQKALQKLFPAHETIFNVNKNARLTFNRFMKELRLGLKKYMAKFTFKLNLGYIVVSFAMLLITEAFISYFKISSLFTFAVLAVASSVSYAFLLLWRLQLTTWLKAIVRFFVVDVCFCAFVLMSLVVSIWTAGILLVSEIVIMVALHFYDKRYGLIRYYIQDISKYRANIIKNADNIAIGKDFFNYQSAIWVLDLSKDIIPLQKEEYYKIPIMENIVKVLG